MNLASICSRLVPHRAPRPSLALSRLIVGSPQHADALLCLEAPNVVRQCPWLRLVHCARP